MATCEKCGSKVFLVDETITHLEVDGEIVKDLGSGDLHNRNCLRCKEPDVYEAYKSYDEARWNKETQEESCPNCAY